MGARRSTPSSARERYYRRRAKRTGGLILVALLVAVIVCSTLVYPVLAPDAGVEVSLVNTATPTLTQEPQETEEPVQTEIPASDPDFQQTLQYLPTQGQIVPPSEDPNILYYTIGGDSLDVISLHFGVEMDEIASPDSIDHDGLLPPGQLLIIPNRLGETSSTSKLLPDSEVTFSPSTVDFDIQAFVDQAGGYLSTYTEYLMSTGWTSGADIISRVALEYSVNPRLLLAFLEYRAGWVYGEPQTEFDRVYPMGHADSTKEDLYLQCAWFASTVMDGYYGWREGRTLVVDYLDGQEIRLAPQLNAGTVGLMHAFAKLYEFDDWVYRLYGEESFFMQFETMFDSPWIRAQGVEPLIPADTEQPEMILPFEVGALWAFSGGPHAAWSAADVWAALDFAPASAESGCHESNAWILASMPGLIVRSGNGVVVIDLDGDGHEQTGWTLLYLHIATRDRIEEGTWVEVGDRIGHPSCEGGRATGTHVHMARRYNGEWVPADGPLPFTLSGWEAKAANTAYEGWLIRDGDIIFANTVGTQETQITRDE